MKKNTIKYKKINKMKNQTKCGKKLNISNCDII